MPKKAFVSYAHESGEHKNQVLALATLLRQNGVEAVLDMWAADTRIDWYAWALKEMTEADYIVVVASTKYLQVADGAPSGEHRGVQSEAALLRDLVWNDRARWLPKILPVLLPGHQVGEIPLFLQPSTASRYQVTEFTARGIEDLLRVILSQPGHIPPPVAEPPVLPVLSGGPVGAPSAPVIWTVLETPVEVRWRADITRRPLMAGTAELHLVPVGPVNRCSVLRLRELSAELGGLGQRHGVFQDISELRTDSSSSTAWAGFGTAGLAVLRSGQRSAWFMAGDEDELTQKLAVRIRLLTGIDVDQPGMWAPTAGFEYFRGRSVRLEANESVTDQDLRRKPDEVAKELAARLFAALHEPPPPPATDRRIPRTGNIHNNFSGNVSGTVIQAGYIDKFNS
jgi:hypothetical protein